jgi:hypothetical protein
MSVSICNTPLAALHVLCTSRIARVQFIMRFLPHSSFSPLFSTCVFDGTFVFYYSGSPPSLRFFKLGFINRERGRLDQLSDLLVPLATITQL